jgi:hypothetical protein
MWLLESLGNCPDSSELCVRQGDLGRGERFVATGGNAAKRTSERIQQPASGKQYVSAGYDVCGTFAAERRFKVDNLLT